VWCLWGWREGCPKVVTQVRRDPGQEVTVRHSPGTWSDRNANQEHKGSQAWRLTPLIPALGRLRQEDGDFQTSVLGIQCTQGWS
jgi:hypothetical protein